MLGSSTLTFLEVVFTLGDYFLEVAPEVPPILEEIAPTPEVAITLGTVGVNNFVGLFVIDRSLSGEFAELSSNTWEVKGMYCFKDCVSDICCDH